MNAPSLNIMWSSVLAVLLVAGSAAGHAGRAQPDSGQPAAGQPAKSQVQVGDFADAGQLLDALELADEGLATLTAMIRYDRTFELAGDFQARQGDLLFRIMPGAEGKRIKQFELRFTTLITGQRVETDKPQVIVFDGEWLAEVSPAEKVFNRRQVVAPGETFDPLRVGEGPLPIPIGQKKADILARYNAELLPAEDGLSSDGLEPDEAKRLDTARKNAAGSYQLKLVPRGDADEDFREIRLWYRRADAKDQSSRLLPRMARAVNRAGDVSLVTLANVKVNGEVPANAFDTRLPSSQGDPSWSETVSGYRHSRTPDAAAAKSPPAGRSDGPGGGDRPESGPSPAEKKDPGTADNPPKDSASAPAAGGTD